MVSVKVLCDPRFDPDLTYTIYGETVEQTGPRCIGNCEKCEADHKSKNQTPPCMKFI